MESIKRGNVCWIKLDPTQGSEIGKTRPAIIVSNDINNEFSNTVSIVPVTSNIKKVYPFEVFLKKGSGGLKNDSKAKANQIRTVDKKRVKGVIGFLPQAVMKKIDEAMKIHLCL